VQEDLGRQKKKNTKLWEASLRGETLKPHAQLLEQLSPSFPKPGIPGDKTRARPQTRKLLPSGKKRGTGVGVCDNQGGVQTCGGLRAKRRAYCEGETREKEERKGRSI